MKKTISPTTGVSFNLFFFPMNSVKNIHCGALLAYKTVHEFILQPFSCYEDIMAGLLLDSMFIVPFWVFLFIKVLYFIIHYYCFSLDTAGLVYRGRTCVTCNVRRVHKSDK